MKEPKFCSTASSLVSVRTSLNVKELGRRISKCAFRRLGTSAGRTGLLMYDDVHESFFVVVVDEVKMVVITILTKEQANMSFWRKKICRRSAKQALVAHNEHLAGKVNTHAILNKLFPPVLEEEYKLTVCIRYSLSSGESVMEKMKCPVYGGSISVSSNGTLVLDHAKDDIKDLFSKMSEAVNAIDIKGGFNTSVLVYNDMYGSVDIPVSYF